MVQLNNESLDVISDVTKPVKTRILLLGDSGVGKTSLISTLKGCYGRSYCCKLLPNTTEVNIVANFGPDEVCITIADFSQYDPSQDLAASIQKATVICIVYVSGCHDSLDRVAKHWMPTIREAQNERMSHKPIVLVANKIDREENNSLHNKLYYIKQRFLDIEDSVEISAQNFINIPELLSAAQKASAYPLAPLFDLRTRNLTAKCREALIEIFKLCDHDGDMLMDDHEINMFQVSCFGTPLKQDALEDLKNVIKQSCVDGIVDNALTLDGFLFLHALSIDKGRQDFTWEVLDKYDYDKQLNSMLANSTTTEVSRSNSIGEDSISTLNEDTKNHSEIDTRSKIRWRERISLSNVVPQVHVSPLLLKTGLALTVTTFISFMALKFLMRSISKT